MKRIIIILISCVIISISVFYVKYIDYKAQKNEIKKENLEYEQFTQKLIDGRKLTTIINKAVNNNEKYFVSKDTQGFYIKDDKNSINIDIKIIDNNTTYKMETIYNGGMENFAEYYGSINFECSNIDYNSLGKVSYMCFEQKTT